MHEDSGSKLFCIEISLLLIDMNVNGWNLNWLDVELFVVEKNEIENLKFIKLEWWHRECYF